MTRRILAALLFIPVLASVSDAQDLFLKAGDYFIAPKARVTFQVSSGAFGSSEGTVAREQLTMLKLAAHDTIVALPHSGPAGARPWSLGGAETNESGTYVIGASLKPREVRTDAFAFNKYLLYEGQHDVFEDRKRAGKEKRPVVERHSKHVKAVVQVGDVASRDWMKPVGSEAEIIPRDDPSVLKPGGFFRIWCSLDGKPARGVVVIVRGRTTTGDRIMTAQYRTSASGVARFPIPKAGTYFVKFMSMKALRSGPIDYESQSATLTFAVRSPK